MLEVYSLNLQVAEGDGTSSSPSIPFNNVSIKKGCTVVLTAPATIQFNKCGVYNISCDASVSAGDTVDDIIIQLTKNGILQPQAQSSVTPAAAPDLSTLHFETLVQVPMNNSGCYCSSPTTVEILNLGAAASFKNINLAVTKII